MAEELTQALATVGELVANNAKINLTVNGQVDTGVLRNSITYDVDETDKSVIIGTNIEYAPYVEYGTGKYAANGDGRATEWYIPIGNQFTREQAEKYHFPIISSSDGSMEWAVCSGTHPHPFLLPAVEQSKKQIGQILGKYIVEGIKFNAKS